VVEVSLKALSLGLGAAVTLLVGVIAAQPSTDKQPLERAFKPGGLVRLRLAPAAYRIVGHDASSIRVRWSVDHPEESGRVHVETEVTGATAVVRTSGPHHGVHFDIALPERSDVEVDLSAGDLDVRGIEGNKTLSMWAGDVAMDVGRPDLYRVVDATVRFGDLNARPFSVSKGGIFRSFRWTGKGKYSLSAHLFAGDLTLR
jgi:hypothetical protein